MSGPRPDVPSHNIFEIDGLIFSSNFCSGNLFKVEKSSGVAHEYLLWTAPDNAGTPNSRADGTNAWFHFSLSGAAKGTTLRLQIMNVSNHSSLYKQDMRPVYRCTSAGDRWLRIRNPVKFTKQSERSASVTFEHTIEYDEGSIFFAFTYPYSYDSVEAELAELPEMNNHLLPGSIYYHREILTSTPDGRNINLLTITSVDGSGEKCEPALSGLFPNYPRCPRPPTFPEKEIIFISARVHPGEVPAQYTFKVSNLNLNMLHFSPIYTQDHPFLLHIGYP